MLERRNPIEFGILIRYYQWLGYDSEQFAGVFTFSGSETGDIYADVLPGYHYSIQRAYPAQNFGGQGTYCRFFVQDDIRVNEKLSLNAGLRYEYSPWLNGCEVQISAFDPALSLSIVVGGTRSVPNLNAPVTAPLVYPFFGQYIQPAAMAHPLEKLTYTDKRRWEPRVSFAHSTPTKTVATGGFGVFYESETTDARLTQLGSAQANPSLSFSAPGARLTRSSSTAPVDTSTYGQTTSTSMPSSDIQFALKYDL